LQNTHLVVTVAELADRDEYEDDDGQNPDLTSALPWDLEHVPLEFKRLPVEETIQRSLDFYNFMSTRRTVRFFSSDPVPADVIRNIVRAAGMLFQLHTEILLLFQVPVEGMHMSVSWLVIQSSYNDTCISTA
jgi:hypothetical protein